MVALLCFEVRFVGLCLGCGFCSVVFIALGFGVYWVVWGGGGVGLLFFFGVQGLGLFLGIFWWGCVVCLGFFGLGLVGVFWHFVRVPLWCLFCFSVSLFWVVCFFWVFLFSCFFLGGVGLCAV